MKLILNGDDLKPGNEKIPTHDVKYEHFLPEVCAVIDLVEDVEFRRHPVGRVKCVKWRKKN